MSEAYRVLCDRSDEGLWKTMRLQGIGASEAACLWGRGFIDEEELLKRKVFPYVDDVPPIAHIGAAFEGGILELADRWHGLRATQWQSLCQSTRWPSMTCTPDASMSDGTLVEVKCVFSRDAWAEGPPQKYIIQVQHQLAVTGEEWGLLVGFAWWKMRFCTQQCESPRWMGDVFWPVQRNDEFIRQHAERCEEFWARVEKMRQKYGDSNVQESNEDTESHSVRDSGAVGGGQDVDRPEDSAGLSG